MRSEPKLIHAQAMGEFSRDLGRVCSRCRTLRPSSSFQQGRPECKTCRHGEKVVMSLETTLDTTEAVCATIGGDLWFSEDGPDTETAISICHTCPIMDACRAWGMEHESYGVWGGVRIRTGVFASKQRRKQAAALLASGESAVSVAARTGIPPRILERWAA